MTPALILVNGHPGSGKTTLAAWLTDELGIPCITKDLFKETLYEYAPPVDREASRDLGRLAYELAFTAVETVLRSGTSVILEAPLHRRFSQERVDGLTSAYGASAVQILLSADAAILERRYLDRRTSGERHTGHDVGFTVDELRAGLASPIEALEVEETIEINTNDFDSVDRPFVLHWLTERLGTE